MNKTIIIAGSGPVGSFLAVLCRLAGYTVIVYEKREQFTRNINLKIESEFFKEVQQIITNLHIKSDFFAKFSEFLQGQNNRILISLLEKKFSLKAKAMGVQYIIREVESFQELYKEHEASNPFILDCTGRNSKLRVNEFGSDANNLVITPLQNAMYINFKAKGANNMSLYQVMKYIKDVKLAEVIVSRRVDANGFSDVTIPAFITNDLAETFDDEYPNLNKNPLNPFNTSRRISDEIFFPISSMIGNLIVDGCCVDLDSVRVKKISIECGYAHRRSKGNFACFGDSAVHLAFFKSLKLGFKHALEFFIKLSMFQEKPSAQQHYIIAQFKHKNPHLNPIKVLSTEAKNVYLIVTKVFIYYACYSYCVTDHETERLSSRLGIKEDQIAEVLASLNNNLKDWKWLLKKFESKRNEDITSEIKGNTEKNVFFDYASWFVDIDGKSFIKISEFSRAVNGKYSLYKNDFDFLIGCFKARRDVVKSNDASEATNQQLINIISCLFNQGDRSEFGELKTICAKENSTNDERLSQIFENLSIKPPTTSKKLGLILNANVKSSFIIELIKNELIRYLKPESESF